MPVPLTPGSQRPGTTKKLSDDASGTVRRTVLPNGLRVISETLPGVRSVAFGIWVGVGSRDEAPERSGASHYLEHLLFKGTRRRSALEISSVLEAVGGELNAFTAKEYTCYYARVLDTDLPLAVDVVTDMVTSSLLRTSDFENERGVILEEIAMHDDDPGDAVHDELALAVWGDSSLGRPVLGTPESIAAISRRAVSAHYRRNYRPEDLVVAAAGRVDHAQLLRLVRRGLRDAGLDATEAAPRGLRPGGKGSQFRPTVRVAPRPIEQANLVLCRPGLPRTDDRRFVLGVLNAALGGGMSSRLFQEVREKRGLAYAVYSFVEHYTDVGLFGVYAGCQPARADDVLSICRQELARAAASGLSEAEVARGRGQLSGGLVLGLEDSGSRMSRLGKAELVYGELLSVDEILGRIERVSVDDVAALAGELLDGPFALAAVGPFDDHDFSAAVA